MLRVIGGHHRGRKLKQPDLSMTRPTTDRVKEALFSMIQFQINDSIFLDLFSGSGSIAIEAASRGAMKVMAVEKEPKVFKVLKENVDHLKINNIHLFNVPVMNFLENANGKKFDFIFMDPPYKENLYNDCLELIHKKKILKELGKIIIETSSPKDIIPPKGMVIQKTKKYGKTTILIISNNI